MHTLLTNINMTYIILINVFKLVNALEAYSGELKCNVTVDLLACYSVSVSIAARNGTIKTDTTPNISLLNQNVITVGLIIQNTRNKRYLAKFKCRKYYLMITRRLWRDDCSTGRGYLYEK